jgi:ACS family hexuronate transporter-like MFS transporter
MLIASAEDAASANTAPKPKQNYRWLIIGLAFLITLINYLDRSAISYAIGPIKQEFHLQDDAFGLIGGAFGFGYAFMTIGGGILSDRFGARKIWALAATAWSLITAFLAAASGLWTFIILRSTLGLAEGPHFPCLARVCGDWLPANERARAAAFGLLAVPLSSVIGAPLISQLIIHLGWRAMFVVLGSAGIVWALIWLLAFRDFPEQSKQVAEEELLYIRSGATGTREKSHEELRDHGCEGNKSSVKSLLSNKSLMINNYAFFCFGYLLFFAVTWLPGFMEHEYGMPLAEVGKFLMIPWATAAVLLAFGGWISDRIYQGTHSVRKSRCHLIWISQLLSALCLLPMLFKPSLNLGIVMVSLGLGFGLMPNAAFYSINCDLAKDRVATSQGLMTMFSSLASMGAPALTGILVTHFHSFAPAFALLIFFALSSVVLVAFFQFPDRAATTAAVSPVGPAAS